MSSHEKKEGLIVNIYFIWVQEAVFHAFVVEHEIWLGLAFIFDRPTVGMHVLLDYAINDAVRGSTSRLTLQQSI